MKHITSLFYSLFICLVMAFAVSTAMDVGFGLSLLGCVAGSIALSFVPMPQGVAQAVVLKQMWETALIEAFRAERTWIGRIPRKDQYVGNNAINVQEVGADPTVLINNTTYPIATAARTDDTLVLALNKYDTTNTKVTRDELYALPYDKEGSVVRQHRDTLAEKTAEHGLFLLAPSGNTASTPVITTTGADNGAGRKRLKSLDLITLKQRLDNLKVPKAGRMLILCSDHVNDLLVDDQSFQLRYNNTEKGSILSNFYGFEIFEDMANPVYTGTTKKAFGAVAVPATDANASTLVFAPRAFQAVGTVEMYHEDATTNPTMRESVVGFRVYNIIAPMEATGFGAIVSAVI
jgi:hypothetical protein